MTNLWIQGIQFWECDGQDYVEGDVFEHKKDDFQFGMPVLQPKYNNKFVIYDVLHSTNDFIDTLNDKYILFTGIL
jgi:hypothetical protein